MSVSNELQLLRFGMVNYLCEDFPDSPVTRLVIKVFTPQNTTEEILEIRALLDYLWERLTETEAGNKEYRDCIRLFHYSVTKDPRLVPFLQ